MKSDIKYINWNNRNKKWVVRATVNGVREYLGSFESLDDAKSALVNNGIPIISNKDGSKYSVNIEYFSKIDTAEKAFWLGFICADGSIKNIRDNIYLRVTQDSDTLLNKFKSDISFTGNVNLVTKKQNGRYSDKPFYELTIHRHEFAKCIIDIGKTRYKKDLVAIPNTIPNEYIIDFIRGYFEGDGSLYFAKSTNSWCFQFSGVKGLLEDIRDVIGMGNLRKDKSIYSLKAGGNLLIKRFIDILYYDDNVYGIKHKAYRGGEPLKK